VFGCLMPRTDEEDELTCALCSSTASQRNRADLSTVMLDLLGCSCQAGEPETKWDARVACISQRLIISRNCSGSCSTNVQLGHGQGAQALDSHLKLGRALRGIVPL
jgi:hypothetical protein